LFLFFLFLMNPLPLPWATHHRLSENSVLIFITTLTSGIISFIPITFSIVCIYVIPKSLFSVLVCLLHGGYYLPVIPRELPSRTK
jgi:hypothetical protein